MTMFKTRLVNVRIKDGWKPKITDHALVRFLERVYGVDVEQVRATMQTDAVRKAVVFGSHSVKTIDGTLIIKGGAVVTFLDKDMRPKKSTVYASKRAERLMQEASA